MSRDDWRGGLGQGVWFVVPVLLLAALTASDQAIAMAAGVPAESDPARTEAATLATLPLERGYYVASDTPCEKASNATTALLRRNGLGGARDFCEFKRVEQVAPSTYRVTQACADLQDGALPAASVVEYTLHGDTAFTSKRADGWAYSARYCAQSTMPPQWRENDIGNVTN